MEAVAFPIYQQRTRKSPRGVLRGVVIVDAEDAAHFHRHGWSLKGTVGGNRYAVRYVQADGRLRSIPLHREILGLPPFIERGHERIEVDHINGNTLDNRRANLRPVTHAQNMQNQRVHASNTSGHRGVYADRGRWRAQVEINGQRHRLGYFVNKEEAALAAAEFRARHMPFSVEPLPAAAN